MILQATTGTVENTPSCRQSSSSQHPGGWAQALEHGVWLPPLPLEPCKAREPTTLLQKD